MRTLCCALALSLAIATTAVAQDSTAAVGQRLTAWAAQWPSGDADKMAAFYEDSDDVSAVISTGKTYTSTAGIHKMYEEAFAEVGWDKVILKNFVVRAEGNVAWATCRFEADITTRKTKTPLRFTSQGTLILRKTGEQWQIAHEHFSPILGVPRVQGRE